MGSLIEFILHIDTHLESLVTEYSVLTYAIIFLIIFFETGVVVMPFLPGDSLLFAAGALAAIDAFRIEILYALIFTAAVVGDTVNYHLGKYFGPKIFKKESSLFFDKHHLIRAKEFYDKHGKKTVVLARFIPIIRTFIPFVAGIGIMDYKTFIFYNIFGAFLWCTIFIFGGYAFGNIPWVQEHFSILVIAIIFISVLPIAKEVVLYIYNKRKSG